MLALLFCRCLHSAGTFQPNPLQHPPPTALKMFCYSKGDKQGQKKAKCFYLAKFEEADFYCQNKSTLLECDHIIPDGWITSIFKKKKHSEWEYRSLGKTPVLWGNHKQVGPNVIVIVIGCFNETGLLLHLYRGTEQTPALMSQSWTQTSQ